MKAFLAVCFMLFVFQARCDDAKDSAAAEDTIKVYKRLIPADVLRGKWFFVCFISLWSVLLVGFHNLCCYRVGIFGFSRLTPYVFWVLCGVSIKMIKRFLLRIFEFFSL